jgi:hypothetical protein
MKRVYCLCDFSESDFSFLGEDSKKQRHVFVFDIKEKKLTNFNEKHHFRNRIKYLRSEEG